MPPPLLCGSRHAPGPGRGDQATLLGKGHSYFFQYNYMLLQGSGYWIAAEGMDGMRTASLSDRGNLLDVWHHAAVVYDADKRYGKIYINGVLDHTVLNSPSRNPVNRYPVLIGVRLEDGKRCFNGLIDDVRLYTRVLTDQEIAGLVPGAVVNAPPTLSAGTNQTISQGMTAQLSGTYQDDHRPDTSSMASWVQWRKVSGPGDVVFANRFALETQVRFSNPGVYLLELHGSDGGHNVFSTATITVDTTKPPGMDLKP